MQIVHLKRFQFVNHRWIKSHKAVHFPLTNLDLNDYLAAIPRETLLRHRELKYSQTIVAEADAATAADETTETDGSPAAALHSTPNHSNGCPPTMGSEDNSASAESTRRRLESTSLITHPVRDEELHDFHQHRLLPGSPKLDITYSLYASVVSHTLMR